MFNVRLKRLREWRNLSQKQLGQPLDYTQQTVQKWESAKGQPDIDLLPKIAAILKVPVGMLLGDTLVEEASGSYQNPEAFIRTMTQSDAFLSLYEIDPNLSQEELDEMSKQLYQMTQVIIQPYKQK